MSGREAWSRGWGVLRRHPWLALLPISWALIRVLLTYAGLPLGFVGSWERMLSPNYFWLRPGGASQVQEFSLTAHLPTFLPSVESLGITLMPEAVASPVLAPGWLLLTGQLAATLGGAFFMGLFLGLIALAIRGRPISLTGGLRRAWRALPALAAINLTLGLGAMLLPKEGAVLMMLLWVLLFHLSPVAIAAGGLPLLPGLASAPALLYGRLGAWFGLGWRTLLTTALLTLALALVGRPLWATLIAYSFVATALVAAAAALVLAPQEPAPEAPWNGRALAGSALAAGVAALAVVGVTGQWTGFLPTREAHFHRYTAVVYVRPEPNGQELVIYRSGNGTGLARMERSRFGWKLLWDSSWASWQHDGEPVAVRVTQPRNGPEILEEQIVWGERFDSRVESVLVEGSRYHFDQPGPFFLHRPLGSLPPANIDPGPVEPLDRNGQPVPKREVR